MTMFGVAIGLRSRGLTEAAHTAGAGYAPSRPGHWTLLLDHLRRLDA